MNIQTAETVKQLKNELAESRSENLEQCRIIGMGAERELALLTKLEKLEKLLCKYQNDTASTINA